jgi:hypothetical protein
LSLALYLLFNFLYLYWVALIANAVAAAEKKRKLKKRVCNGDDLDCRYYMMYGVLNLLHSMLKEAIESNGSAVINVKLYDDNNDEVYDSTIKIDYPGGVLEAPNNDLIDIINSINRSSSDIDRDICVKVRVRSLGII